MFHDQYKWLKRVSTIRSTRVAIHGLETIKHLTSCCLWNIWLKCCVVVELAAAVTGFFAKSLSWDRSGVLRVGRAGAGMIRVAASLCSAASGAVAAAGAGMRQVTDSRKAAARYRAEYLRQSNAPTSAAATCDNTVRCACVAPRTPSTPLRCIPNDIGLETSREISAHSIRAPGPSYSIPLAYRILQRDVTSGYILITKLTWSMQECSDFKTNSPAYFSCWIVKIKPSRTCELTISSLMLICFSKTIVTGWLIDGCRAFVTKLRVLFTPISKHHWVR